MSSGVADRSWCSLKSHAISTDGAYRGLHETRHGACDVAQVVMESRWQKRSLKYDPWNSIIARGCATDPPGAPWLAATCMELSNVNPGVNVDDPCHTNRRQHVSNLWDIVPVLPYTQSSRDLRPSAPRPSHLPYGGSPVLQEHHAKRSQCRWRRSYVRHSAEEHASNEVESSSVRSRYCNNEVPHDDATFHYLHGSRLLNRMHHGVVRYFPSPPFHGPQSFNQFRLLVLLAFS